MSLGATMSVADLSACPAADKPPAGRCSRRHEGVLSGQDGAGYCP